MRQDFATAALGDMDLDAPEPMRRMNRTTGIELYHLHQACAELYWWASRPVVRRVVALSGEELLRYGFRLDSKGFLSNPPASRAMKQLQHLLKVRQLACFRPYLERVAHVRGISYQAVVAELRAMAVPLGETR